MLNPSEKTEIDDLTLDDLVHEMMNDFRSRFKCEAREYFTARYIFVEKEDETKHKQQQLALSREANDISKSASRIATKADYVSIFSIVVAIITLVFTAINS